MSELTLGEVLYESVLMSIELPPFSKMASLIFVGGSHQYFADRATRLQVFFRGIHLAMFRQSPGKRFHTPPGVGCSVHYAEIVVDSAFLHRYKKKELDLSSGIEIYDPVGKHHSDPSFSPLKHFCLVCEAGHFDCIFHDVGVVPPITEK